MSKRLSDLIDPILIVGIFISIAISLGMVLAGNDTVSGLMVGLLTTIITLLIDIIARLEKAEANLLEAAKITELIAEPEIGQALQEIANNYRQMTKYNFSHYYKIAKISFAELRERLRQLSSGAIIVPTQSELSYGTIGMNEAKKEVKVIHKNNLGFWETDYGKSYLKKNYASIKRGVKITRIFALSHGEIEEGKSLLEKQENSGIKVIIIGTEQIDSPFMIIDGQVVLDFDIDINNQIAFEKIVVDPAYVKRKIEQFESLISRHGKTLKYFEL